MSNPALSQNAQQRFIQAENELEVMSVQGAVLKTAFLLAILVFASVFTSYLMLKGYADKASLLMMCGAIGGFIVAMINIFTKNPKWTAPLSITYAALEGLFIGGISTVFAVKFGPGLIGGAVAATFSAVLAMLILYSLKIIQCTQKFMATIFISTAAIAIIYLLAFIASFFNPNAFAFLFSNGLIGIGFSIIVCLIAAFNLIIDFSMIEQAKDANLNKDFEWYGAFSLMITIIWLYIEVLKLLAKFNSRE